MNYKEFAEAFVAVPDAKKAAFAQKHIVKTYLPYESKISESQKIVELSNYKEINGKKEYIRNSPLSYMLFIIRVLANYTDIEWEDKDTLDVFNCISSSDALDWIINAIPKKEYDTFQTVLQMCSDDEYENYRSLAGFFGTKIEALELSLGAIADALPEIADSELHKV